MAKPATPGKPADTPSKPTAPDIAQQPIDKPEPVALAVEPTEKPDVVFEAPLWGEETSGGEDGHTTHTHHIVHSRDTWGTLVAMFGPDIAKKNGKKFADPLVAGTHLEV